jgi:hypothetical protein
MEREEHYWQGAEKVALLTLPTLARRDAPIPMHRSRIAQRGLTYRSVRFASSLAAALLDSLFEHPAEVCFGCALRAGHRSSAALKQFSRSLLVVAAYAA